jgi:hypothetical protein
VGGVLASIEFEKLESFVMEGEFPYWDEEMFLEAARNGRLRNLSHLVLLQSGPFRCEDLLRWNMPRLTTVELFVGEDHADFLSRPNIPKPFENMPQLERVSLVWYSNTLGQLGEVPFTRFVDAAITDSVTELFLHTVQVYEFTIHGLRSQFPNMRRFGIGMMMLMVGGPDLVARDLVRVFPNLTNLVVLEISRHTVAMFEMGFGGRLRRALGDGWSYRVTDSFEVDGDPQVQTVEFFRS